MWIELAGNRLVNFSAETTISPIALIGYCNVSSTCLFYCYFASLWRRVDVQIVVHLTKALSFPCFNSSSFDVHSIDSKITRAHRKTQAQMTGGFYVDTRIATATWQNQLWQALRQIARANYIRAYAVCRRRAKLSLAALWIAWV